MLSKIIKLLEVLYYIQHTIHVNILIRKFLGGTHTGARREILQRQSAVKVMNEPVKTLYKIESLKCPFYNKIPGHNETPLSRSMS